VTPIISGAARKLTTTAQNSSQLRRRVKALRKQTKAWYTKASMDSPRATGLFGHGSLRGIHAAFEPHPQEAWGKKLTTDE
jgi:hypothetical protein